MKKLLLSFILTIILCTIFVVSVSATTYYCDKNGSLIDATSENIAYEFDLANNRIPYLYLHDTTVTKIVLPNIEEYTGQVQMQANYDKSLEIYSISDKETKANNLKTQITEVEIHESIYLDGAYSVGVFAGYTGLQKISFYDKVAVASKGGFFQNCVITEVNFYGAEIAVPSKLISSLSNSLSVTIVFHKGSSGTLSTGGDTLPTYGSLNNWKIVINENIKPSNANDTRLGAKWGATVATTGWELIVAVDNINSYTQAELEALKTSHGFCSRAESVDTATVKEATVSAYCTLGYSAHENATTYGFDGDNKYTSNFCKYDGCKNCTNRESTSYGPLFTSKGYSKENGSSSFTYGIVFNASAIALYEKELGATFDYGFIVGSVPAGADGKIVNADGTTTLEKSIITSVSEQNYSIYNIKLVGIDSDDYKALEVYCCAYIIDNGTVVYAGKEITEIASTISYNKVDTEQASSNDSQAS